MKKVLVTGGAGYVGSVLLRDLLGQGYAVYCLDKLDFGGDSIVDLVQNSGFTFINCDLNDHEQLRQELDVIEFDSVIHLAAIVGDPACKLQPDLATRTNWESSVFLFDYCVQRGIDKFVFASTCSNYGKMPDPDAFVDENSPLVPISLYAELKVNFENYLIQSDTSVCTTALRFATVYGLSPRMRFELTVNEFTKELALGNQLSIYGEQFWRPYCHVRDFSRAFIAVLEADETLVANEVFNVGATSENYTKKMLSRILSSTFPDADIEFIQKEEDARDYRVNCDKIRKVLGYDISQTVPEGIEEIKQVLQCGLIGNPDDKRYYNVPV